MVSLYKYCYIYYFYNVLAQVVLNSPVFLIRMFSQTPINRAFGAIQTLLFLPLFVNNSEHYVKQGLKPTSFFCVFLKKANYFFRNLYIILHLHSPIIGEYWLKYR